MQLIGKERVHLRAVPALVVVALGRFQDLADELLAVGGRHLRKRRQDALPASPLFRRGVSLRQIGEFTQHAPEPGNDAGGVAGIPVRFERIGRVDDQLAVLIQFLPRELLAAEAVVFVVEDDRLLDERQVRREILARELVMA